MPHDPEIRKTPYPGRGELDAANRRFRKAVARLHREGLRTNKNLVAQVEAIVEEATEQLTRLAQQAERATLEEPVRRTLRKAVRAGSARAAATLAHLDEQAARHGRPADDARG